MSDLTRTMKRRRARRNRKTMRRKSSQRKHKTRSRKSRSRKMRGGGEETIVVKKYFPVDDGDFLYTLNKHNDLLSSHNIIIGKNHTIILPENYFYVIIHRRSDIKELLIFRIDDDNILHQIFGITQKESKSGGAIITTNHFTDYSTSSDSTYHSGVPTELPITTNVIFKIGNSYDTLKFDKYNLYGLISGKDKNFSKDEIDGYYIV